MPPNNPTATVNLNRSRFAENPQGLHGIGIVIGYTAGGHRNTIHQLVSDESLKQFKGGEGAEHAAEIGAEAGYPVYLLPIEGTRQSAGSVTKTPASAGVPYTVYGSVLLNGADLDGDVLFQGLRAGVTLTVVSGVTLGFAFSGVDGNDVTLTVTGTTTGAQLETAYLASADAQTRMSTIFYGDKDSVVGQTLAKTAFDLGRVTYTPLAPGYELKHGLSANTTTTAAFGTAPNDKQLTLSVGKNADGQPIGTPAGAISVLAPITNNKIDVDVQAPGSGTLGLLPSFVPLQFGSTGAMTVSGTGTDAYDVLIQATRSASVGSGSAAFIWSADGGITWSSEVVIPSSGVVFLRDASIDTGLLLTFTGTLELGDIWSFSVAKPVVAFADILSALDIIEADTTVAAGFITSPTSINRTQAAQIEAWLLKVRQRKWLRGFFNTRDGGAQETIQAFEASIETDFLGFTSDKGALRMLAGYYSHFPSPLTGRRFRRPLVMNYTGRRCRMAVHQDPMERATDAGGGPLSRIRFAKDPVTGAVIDPGIYYNAYPSGRLPAQRFICARTYDSPSDVGKFYINTSPTMSDPSDRGYSRVPYGDYIFECARVAQVPLNDTLGKTYASIPEEESALIPAGALDAAAAQGIDNKVNEPLEKYMFSVKTDGNPSGSPNPSGERPYKTRRDYNYASGNPPTVRGSISVYLRAINEQVVVDLTPVLPG